MTEGTSAHPQAAASAYRPLPAVLPIGRFAEGDFGAEIASAGGRALPGAAIGDGPQRIELAIGTAVVVAALTEDEPREAIEAVLRAIREGVAALRFGAILIVPPALIDAAAATLDSEGTILVDPDADERQAALRGALAPRAAMLHDVGSEAAARGGALREEVARIARRLAALSGTELPTLRDRGSDYAAPPARDPTDAGTIRAIIRARRLRDQYFAPDLFADPAWDMLLDLMAARLEGEEVAVSSLCIAAAVPPTTALRWIKLLTDAGLLVRRADPLDRRRVFIALADHAAGAMQGYLAAVARGGMPPLV